MEKKDKNRTQTTKSTGDSDYKGYNSIKMGTYDDLTDDIEQTASEMGGVLDNNAKTYGGQRYKFKTKEQRDKFNNIMKKKQEKKEEKDKKLNESVINSIIRRSVRTCLMEMVNEDLQSPRLRALAKEHGGIWHAYTRGGYREVPISDITDDMLGDEVITDKRYPEEMNHGIRFKDGSVLPFVPYESEGGQKVLKIGDSNKKFKDEREYGRCNKYNDGSVSYQPRSAKGAVARNARQAMQIGYNTVKDEDSKDYRHQDSQRRRDAVNMIQNAKKAHQYLKSNPKEYEHKYY